MCICLNDFKQPLLDTDYQGMFHARLFASDRDVVHMGFRIYGMDMSR